jgi:flagellar protein FlbD
MIHLTRLNGNPLVVNSDLIKYAESSPDTMLTLVNGEKIVVLESCEEVVSRTIAYRARVHAEAAGNLFASSTVSEPPADSEPPETQPGPHQPEVFPAPQE